MKKGIIVLLALCAAAAYAADLNPDYGRAGHIENPPCLIVTGDGFKKLWDNASAILGDPALILISTDDDEWLAYSPEDPHQWIYMIIKFTRSGGCDGTCFWQVKMESQAVVTVWRWDHRPWVLGGQRFVYMDNNNGGINPPTESFSVSSSDFNPQGVLFLLVQGQKGTGAWQMKCDVIDIHY
jgi:hypothetical protein